MVYSRTGINERRASQLWPAFQRDLRRARTATWAATAQEEHDRLRVDLRRQHAQLSTTRFELPCEGWWAIPKPKRTNYLDGRQHPQIRTIEAVTKHSPRSAKVWESVLWVVLSPQCELRFLTHLVNAFDESRLDRIVGGLRDGDPYNVANDLQDLNATAMVVAKIRLLVNEKRIPRAFDLACALVQMLCYHAINPLYGAAAMKLWHLTSKVVLEGLVKDGLQFSRCLDGFAGFTSALRDRIHRAHTLYGVERLGTGPRFRWETLVDLSHHGIFGFATPELGGAEGLHSLLDSKPTPDGASLAQRDPLFRPAIRQAE
ncbi:hypothetical protein [Dyella japonica]|uniref:Uncharacterized protein n=1 Tax=Dyella japonica A8 TaxID=1217721 RepID=A0A075K7P7_9GAMM|nr:hypothetical protein [Dyella japonica]AIF48153.1 hypothetical protein HY57_13230 [Dyella japonica A8]